MDLTYICKISDIPAGGVKQISLPGRDEELAVYRLDDGYYVTDDMCTHGMVSLSGGDVEDGQIFCPLHGGAFDIRTGKPTELPCRVKLKTYRAELQGDEIHAEVD